MAVEAVVLPKVTTDVPSTFVPFNNNLKHLSNIQLADPDFSTPGNIDFILGADVFSRVLHYGQQFGPPGSLSTFKTVFGWVLVGTVNERPCKHPIKLCC